MPVPPVLCSLTIRRFEPLDSLQALTHLLHRAYAELGAMGLNYTAVDQSPDTTAQRIQGGDCFIALLNERWVGTVLLKSMDADSPCVYYTQAGVATLRQLAVSPDFRGQGLGLQLVQHAEKWARAQQHQELALDTALAAAHLVSWYESLGYKRVARVQWPGKVYESVVLSKSLKKA